MNATGKRLAIVAMCVLLTACASAGTRVTTKSDNYKSMAQSQTPWCQTFGCSCFLDGIRTSCSLVYACLNSGNCTRASQ